MVNPLAVYTQLSQTLPTAAANSDAGMHSFILHYLRLKSLSSLVLGKRLCVWGGEGEVRCHYWKSVRRRVKDVHRVHTDFKMNYFDCSGWWCAVGLIRTCAL